MKKTRPHNQVSKTIHNNIIAALALLMLCGDVLAESAGKVLAVNGQIQALQRDNHGNRMGWRKLNRGSLVYSGDVINTRRNSSVQIRFSDGTLITLKQNTQFSVDNYQHDKKTRTTKKSFFSLLTGSFRSITSLVTDRNKRGYRVKTKVATIGVRGTDYEASICNINCGGMPEGQLDLNVFEGEISIENEAGEFLMQHGDTGHVPDARTPVQVTAEPQAVKQQREQLIAATSENTGDQTEDTADNTEGGENTDGTETTDEANDGTTDESTDDSVDSIDIAVEDSSVDEIIVSPETNDILVEFVGGDVLQCIKF